MAQAGMSSSKAHGGVICAFAQTMAAHKGKPVRRKELIAILTGFRAL